MVNDVERILPVEDNDADVYLFQKALETAEVKFELTIIGVGKSGGIHGLRAIRERESLFEV